MNDGGVCRTAPATPGLLKRFGASKTNNLRLKVMTTNQLNPHPPARLSAVKDLMFFYGFPKQPMGETEARL